MALSATVTGAPSGADATQQQRQRLQALRDQVDALRAQLSADRDRYSALSTTLRTTETAIGRHTRELSRLDASLSEQRAHLARLAQRKNRLSRELEAHRNGLIRQLRSAHATGRQAYLKLLMNQQDPAAVGRTLVYYEYLNRARAQRIAAIDDHLAEVRAVTLQIEQETARLNGLRAAELAARAALEDSRAARSAVLQRLHAQIATQEQKLQQVVADAGRLEQLLKGLQQALADTPGLATTGKPFPSLRGKLPMPVQGQVMARFGSRRNIGLLRWQGLLLASKQGGPVSAISHGRVAFADWLRGFGLLVILDHGEGYMSLYGHNESLYVEAGDWVEAGEAIATVGTSGGRTVPGVYFEIRQNGKPTDPLRWCKLDRN